jgi:hypothetical protein
MQSELLKIQEEKDGFSFFNTLNEKISHLSKAYAAQGIFNDNFFGYVSADELKFIMENYYAKIIAETNASKKMCNIKAMDGAAFEEVSDWFEAELMPQLIDAGLRYNAIVLPDDYFASITVENILEDEPKTSLDSVNQRFFDSKEKALAWLKSL